MTEKPDRLYGLPWAEVLYLTPVEVYEHVIDGSYESPKPVEIDEWTICDNKQFMPSVDIVLERIGDILADEAISEDWYDAFEKVEGDDEVVAAFQAALDLLASKIPFNMADKHVASHWITWDDAGNPLLNGDAIYGSRTKPPMPAWQRRGPRWWFRFWMRRRYITRTSE